MLGKKQKRKYEQRVFNRAGTKENREFLLSNLTREWEIIEDLIKKDKRRQKLYDLTKETGKTLGTVLLGIIAVCGAITIAAVAPNILSAFGRTGKHRRYFNKQDFNKQLSYFRRRGYIKFSKNNGDGTTGISLTKSGEEQVIKQRLASLKVIPQDKWDKIWRIVIFDVPEKNTWARNGLRFYLKRMGFYQLQKSTFVSPHPCREEVEFLGRIYGLDEEIRLIETSNISYDKDIKECFFK